MRKLALALPLAFLLAATAAAQDDPALLLKKVAETYAALSKTSYSFEQVEVREFSGSIRNRTEQRERLVASGGKSRQERLPNGVLYVFDGQYRWAYNPERNEYTQEHAPNGQVRPFGFSMIQMAAYPAAGARFLRQENVELASGPVMCQVIEVAKTPAANGIAYSPMMFWIDASRSLVLKLRYTFTAGGTAGQNPSETTITDSFTKATIGEAVDESLFRFKPPTGAVLVERLSFAPKSSLVGKDSPDFELQGPDGKPVSSGSLRGHAALLQFGRQTDDDSLLLLEMTYRSLKGKGLAAYYVLPPSNLPRANTDAYTVPVAVDSDGTAAKKFGISFTGTVLIDSRGKIAFLDTSSRNSQELARALQTAGVW